MSAQRHELHLLTGGYAIDALTDAERAEFEKHLDQCPSCAEEVRGLRETAAKLALATAVTPPPGMRSRVLAAVPRTSGSFVVSVVTGVGVSTFVSTCAMNSWSIGYLACCFLDAQIRALKLKTKTNTTSTSAIPHTSVRRLGHSDLAFS